ncbi:MAG: 5-(carboxyamino)imidazole ribonucleotide synthase [Janthinobacterium lividum]
MSTPASAAANPGMAASTSASQSDPVAHGARLAHAGGPPILPGAWLGILGGGQLGRMFCFAAQSMGYRVAVLDPDPHSPAGAVADRQLRAAYDDPAALAELAALCEAVTTEFENVPAASLDALARTVRVSPAGCAVAVAQDRIAEKRFLADCVGVAPHLVIESVEQLDRFDDAAFAPVLPGIVKTARLGYDGKGQVRVATADEARQAFRAFDGAPCVLEKRLSLAFEVSALVARGFDGECVVYPIAQNVHRDGILAETVVPAPSLDLALTARVRDEARTIAAELDYVGVLCVEFFVLHDGSLVANEMAPRPHNSGHYTIDACVSSQFEQQVRAMTGLPLGDTSQHSAAVMLNVLGDVWFAPASGNAESAHVRSGSSLIAVEPAVGAPVAHTPAWDAVVGVAGAHLHLYGKEDARQGRKMGHITCTAPTLEAARAASRTVAAQLHIPLDR